MKLSAAAWILAFALMLIAVTAPAQIPQLPGSGGRAIPANLASPRATMRTYLEGMNNADVGRAVDALDLDRVNPIERSELGPELAFRLWAILNRQEYIQVGDLSDAANASAYVLPITDRDNRSVGAIAIEKDDDGAFRFGEETISGLDALWEKVKDKPVIHGLDDVSLRTFAPSLYVEQQLPDSAKVHVAGLPLYKWVLIVGSLIMAAVGVALIRLATAISARILLRLPKTGDAYKSIDRAGKALSLVILCTIGHRNYPYLGLPNLVGGILGSGFRIAIIVGWVMVAFSFWDVAVETYIRRVSPTSASAERLVAPVLSRLGKAFIVVVAGIYILMAVGVNVTAFIATLGIGGLVIALAAKDSVENLFGSVMVLIERPFQIGDWVRIGDVSGEVEEIRLRSTRIRSFEDSVIILPNKALVTSNVENFGMRRHRRLKTTVEIVNSASNESVGEFTSRVRQLLLENEHVSDEHRFVYLNDYGATTRQILIDCYLDAASYQAELEYREQILMDIMKIGEDLGLRFAMPTSSESK